MQVVPVGKLEPAVPLVMEAAQAAAVVMVVVQVEPRQQTPGGVQGLGVQEPPAVKVPVVQAAWRPKVQTPAVSQQVPGCGQGLGEQEAPAVKVKAQAPASVREQAETLQHEPAGLLAVTIRLIVPVVVPKEPTRMR